MYLVGYCSRGDSPALYLVSVAQDAKSGKLHCCSVDERPLLLSCADFDPQLRSVEQKSVPQSTQNQELHTAYTVKRSWTYQCYALMAVIFEAITAADSLFMYTIIEPQAVAGASL